jgi:hypothetical protein
MLQVQFRMALRLRQLVSHSYYDDCLQDSDCVLHQGPNKNAKLRPLLVVNVTGSMKTFSPLHQSYENIEEAMIVAMIWSWLLGADLIGTLPDSVGQLTTKDICILTPFNRHKERLRMQICGINEKDLDSYSGQTFKSQNNCQNHKICLGLRKIYWHMKWLRWRILTQSTNFKEASGRW